MILLGMDTGEIGADSSTGRFDWRLVYEVHTVWTSARVLDRMDSTLAVAILLAVQHADSLNKPVHTPPVGRPDAWTSHG